MYSMIVMMALSTSGVAYECHGTAGCAGAACHGWSCHGGSRCFGLFRRHGCHGCNGWSCHGRRCHGCNGSACHGHVAACNGCHGCNGSRCFGLFRRHGCHGWNNCCGTVVVSCTGCAGAPSVKPPAEGEKAPDAKPSDKKAPEESALNQATLIVSLPADAKLFIQGQATTTTGATRTFVSPTLEAGKDYVYTLKAEVVRDGKPLSVTREVTVRAGQTVETSLEFPVAVAAN